MLCVARPFSSLISLSPETRRSILFLHGQMTLGPTATNSEKSFGQREGEEGQFCHSLSYPAGGPADNLLPMDIAPTSHNTKSSVITNGRDPAGSFCEGYKVLIEREKVDSGFRTPQCPRRPTEEYVTVSPRGKWARSALGCKTIL